ncbi:radical SAM protein [Desulfosarcina sp.]|uniref:radical SAM protein n=1 Tax=Desulfosarcina sp. TaxID=2027861 RepID=UPI0029BDA361|nr:radical SAM protein [Desulfosarcina sp.]MDX2455391.1 radical SAM protein [Desulfosarcina sp.]MDX2492909.1 radical SAM protein [Desulfosarcina sp.]
MSGSQADRQLPLPSVLYLETTNRCNLRCKGCILYRGSSEPDRDVSLNELVTITDQLPALERVFLHGIGEPLLNKALFEMIRHLKQRQVYVLFNSNGVLLDKRKQHDLIQAGLDELRISLDAASAQGYRNIRNSDRFEHVVENIKSFIALQTQQQAAHPKLSVWFLGTRDNIAELPGLVDLAAEMGIKEIYLQRLVYFQDNEGYGIARQARTLRGATDGSLALIQKSQDMAARQGIRFNASGLSAPVESLGSGDTDEQPWHKCHRPYSLMYITANGNVLPCCISPFSSVDYRSLILGNVFKSPLKEIWTGARYSEFRKQHQTETPPTCCRGCGVQWSL